MLCCSGYGVLENIRATLGHWGPLMTTLWWPGASRIHPEMLVEPCSFENLLEGGQVHARQDILSLYTQASLPNRLFQALERDYGSKKAHVFIIHVTSSFTELPEAFGNVAFSPYSIPSWIWMSVHTRHRFCTFMLKELFGDTAKNVCMSAKWRIHKERICS